MTPRRGGWNGGVLNATGPRGHGATTWAMAAWVDSRDKPMKLESVSQTLNGQIVTATWFILFFLLMFVGPCEFSISSIFLHGIHVPAMEISSPDSVTPRGLPLEMLKLRLILYRKEKDGSTMPKAYHKRIFNGWRRPWYCWFRIMLWILESLEALQTHSFVNPSAFFILMVHLSSNTHTSWDFFHRSISVMAGKRSESTCFLFPGNLKA